MEWLQDYENVSLVLTVYPGRTTDMTSGFLVMLGAGIANTHQRPDLRQGTVL